MRRLLRRLLMLVLTITVALPLALTLLYRFVPPPITPLMLIRMAEGEGLAQQWRSLEDMAVSLPAAVIAAEDNLFCRHSGLDFDAIRAVWRSRQAGGRLRGASTISQQTAKNLFLWPSRDWVRKGLEAYLTLMLETLWPKRRILEVYLNIVEFDNGVYGGEAAAQHYFAKPAARLTAAESALLASILPDPRGRSAATPGPRLRQTAAMIQRRVGHIRPLLDCIAPR